ncbi:hypothetical protein V6238_12795 [Marinomonas arenicola]|uniref:hypothetical protein n=1 Tax=Marinomonas arenicola TaxID=569601 RepID=UPI00311D61D4
MDILQEVIHSKTLIDELLHDLSSYNARKKGEPSELLPDEMSLKLDYVMNTHKKLLENDDFSLSAKGVTIFREESQSLLYYLRNEYQSLQLSHAASKKGNRLFNYKNHILTWEEPIRWTAVLLHSAFLIIAILLLAAWSLLAFNISDKNNLILLSSLISVIFIFSPNPPIIKESGISKKFTLISASFLFWKSIFRALPIIAICITIAIYNNFWRDDALIIFSVAFIISILYTRNKCKYWLTTPSKIDLVDGSTQSGDSNV